MDSLLLWCSYLSHCSSGGQVTPKTCISFSQSDRTLWHCSLHGRITLFSSVHAGIKAWHRKWWTSGEQRRLASGMNGWGRREKLRCIDFVFVYVKNLNFLRIFYLWKCFILTLTLLKKSDNFRQTTEVDTFKYETLQQAKCSILTFSPKQDD